MTLNSSPGLLLWDQVCVLHDTLLQIGKCCILESTFPPCEQIYGCVDQGRQWRKGIDVVESWFGVFYIVAAVKDRTDRTCGAVRTSRHTVLECYQLPWLWDNGEEGMRCP